MIRNNDITQRKVDATEIKDRVIAEKVLEQYSTDKFEHMYTVSGKTVDCPYDIEGVDYFPINSVEYCAEIKQNHRNPNYPLKAIIKKKKVEDIFKEAGDKNIYFISLLDDKYGYIFNMRDINWRNTELKNMWQKKRQLEDDEEKVEYYQVPTYFIDYDKAFFCCNITNFLKDFDNAIYSKKTKETYLPS